MVVDACVDSPIHVRHHHTNIPHPPPPTTPYPDTRPQRQLFTANGFKARDLEGLATSLTKLQQLSAGHKPDPSFLDALVRAAAPLLPTARPPTVARLLHALSRLDGYAPSPDFLVEAERACATNAGRWDQSSIALVCQAWSWLRYQPGDATVAALLDRARGMLVVGGSGGGGGGGVFSAQNLGTLIVSLGELNRCPDDEWMALFQAAVLARLPEASSKDISFFLKGLAKLNYYPGADTVDALLAALNPHLPALQGVDLQCIVTSLGTYTRNNGLARRPLFCVCVCLTIIHPHPHPPPPPVGLHHRPPPAFVAAFQTRARELLSPSPDGIGPRDLAIIIWSFAALEIPGARAFLRDLAAAAVAQLRAEQGRWALAEGEAGALSIQERWALTARVRQLRQVGGR